MTVTLQQVVQIMESGNWITNLRFITADVNKGTGGKVIVLKKCRIARNEQKTKSEAESGAESRTGITRYPNHKYHFTRNMKMQNHSLVKVHPLLVTHINSITVI